jgi:hypothetical protein
VRCECELVASWMQKVLIGRQSRHTDDHALLTRTERQGNDLLVSRDGSSCRLPWSANLPGIAPRLSHVDRPTADGEAAQPVPVRISVCDEVTRTNFQVPAAASLKLTFFFAYSCASLY